MTTFEMAVEDTFFLKDGTTVFAGPIVFNGPEKVIRDCECEIIQNSKVRASVRIEGEMRPKRRAGVISSARALSTKQSLDLGALGLGRGGFLLRSKSWMGTTTGDGGEETPGPPRLDILGNRGTRTGGQTRRFQQSQN